MSHTTRCLGLLILLQLGMTAWAADAFITTWRGQGYRGVMPAEDLVRHFICYDEHGPAPDKILPLKDRDADKKLQALGLKAWPTPGTQHNVCWRVPLPSWGQSAPVAVGDKVFVTCDAILQTEGQHVLVCVDIATGQVAWTRPVDHLLAWKDEAKVAEVQQIRLAEVTGWAEAMRTWNGVWWDNERHRIYGSDPDRLEDGFWVIKHTMKGGPHADRQARFAEAQAEGYQSINKGYHQATGRFGHQDRLASFKRAAETRARVYTHNKDTPWYGSTMASVVGDGTAVYAVAAPDAVVCYELDGTLRWAADMATGGRPRSGTHRNMGSPILVAGRLVYFHTNDLRVFAYDCASGALAWRTSLPGEVDSWREREYRKFENGLFPRGIAAHMGPGGTPVPMTLPSGDGEVPVVVIPSGHVFQLSDGACLGWFNQFRGDDDEKHDFADNGYATYGSSVVADNVYFSVHGTATHLAIEDGKLVSKRLWTAVESRGKNNHDQRTSLTLVPGRGLLAGGGRGGGGELWDLTTGKPLATGLRHGGDGYTSGCISADGLMLWHGGFWGPRKTRLATCFNLVPLATPDDYGIGLIVESGTNELPDFEQRLIDRFGVTRIHTGWPHPTAFGNRIFVRTNTRLYCFGKGEWVPHQPTRDKR